jgi:hypothetical protein
VWWPVARDSFRSAWTGTVTLASLQPYYVIISVVDQDPVDPYLIDWPPGSGSLPFIKKMKEKSLIFIIFKGLQIATVVRI